MNRKMPRTFIIKGIELPEIWRESFITLAAFQFIVIQRIYENVIRE